MLFRALKMVWVRSALFLVIFSTSAAWAGAAGLVGRDYAVELTASIAREPPEITLAWPGDQYARNYTISKKGKTEQTWREVVRIEGPSTAYTDRDVQPGAEYEYQVVKESSFEITAYGYILAGIDVPLVEDRGTVILLAEESLATALEPELLRLEFDLIGDGWQVERAVANATNSPIKVKALIQSIYNKHPERTRALLLFGHLPVAYSGNIMPDGHENHQGAWPADVFYADLDGDWTDHTVNSDGAEQKRQWNVPGDGKFDQSSPPSAVELETGRVDFSKLTCFENKTPSRSELDLARQYLDKNHRFRSGEFSVAQRAIIFDRIESKTAEPVAAMAWRNFAPLVGREVSQIGDLQYFPKVSSGTYLWSSVCAGGSYIASDRVGTSDAFALNDVNAVFTTFLGSYFGDWDVESSFLRSVLGASGMVLATAYSGQPQWIFHPMGLGETAGYCARITQENGPDGIYPPHNDGAGEVHVALLGDPTLRAYSVPAIRNLRAETVVDGLIVGWQFPLIEGFVGFHVYTASNSKGPYRRATVQPVKQPSFKIRDFKPGDSVMVKAIALTRTPSGSFYNSSVGVFYPDPLAEVSPRPPAAPGNLSVAKVTGSGITLTWVGGAGSRSGFRLERRDPGALEFREIASTGSEAYTFEDRSLSGAGIYAYRVRAFNAFGNSPYSNEALASTLSGSAEFVGLDRTTQGDWPARYGTEGFLIPGYSEELPPRVSLVTSNVVLYKTGFADDPRAPLVPPDLEWRSANCWVNGTPLAFHFSFSDDNMHQLSFYTAAWGRRQPVVGMEVLDAVTGASLDQRTLTNVDEGVYAIYNVRRQVYVRITPPSIMTNAEIYGVFIDPARVAPLRVEPGSGSFAGRTQVAIATDTPRADIFYTTDGTDPTPSSIRYTGPFWLRTTGTIKARAYRDGLQPTSIVSREYENSVPNLVGVLGWDSETAGDWVKKFGSEGSWLAMAEPSFPVQCEVAIDNAGTWSWSDDSTERRALLVSRSAESRQARTWFADTITVKIGVFDTKMHAISIYFLDYDGGNRVQQIEIRDPAGELKQSLTASDFINGRYLTLAIQGEVHIRINKVSGPNAVLAGIFLDPAPSGLELAKPAPLSGLMVQNGNLLFNMPVFPGLHICTDRSTNLIDWQCTMTNVVTDSTARFGLPIDPLEPRTFFRTHFVP